MLGFSPRLNLSKTFAYEECWKEGRGFLRGKTNARYFSRGNNSMAKVFYRWNLKLSLRCELTKKFQIPVVSLRFFLSISPFQLCTILWNNVPRIFLSLVVRETTSCYRFRLRFDPTPLCFPCKILPRISYPGLYQSLLLSFLFFYPNLPHDLTYIRFLLKSSGTAMIHFDFLSFSSRFTSRPILAARFIEHFDECPRKWQSKS